MEVEKKFISNYLSKRRFTTGKVASVAVLSVCFILSLFFWDKSYSFSQFLSASKQNVFIDGEYWRLFTTSFIHGDLDHLLSNSLMLFILTYFVTSFYGVFISTVLSFVMGIAINYFVISQYEINTTLVGASGVVYFLWGFWLILYICIERQTSLIRRLVRVFGVFLILLVPTTYAANTSYLAHYIGFVLGVINGMVYYLLRKSKISKFESWEYRVVEDDLDFSFGLESDEEMGELDER